MDTSEAGMGSSGSSDSTTQSMTHSQTPQQVLLFFCLKKFIIKDGQSFQTLFLFYPLVFLII